VKLVLDLKSNLRCHFAFAYYLGFKPRFRLKPSLKLQLKGKGKEEYLYSAFLHQGTHKALRHGSHSFTCKQHHACLSLWRSPDVTTTATEAADIQLQLTTHLSNRPRKDERLSEGSSSLMVSFVSNSNWCLLVFSGNSVLMGVRNYVRRKVDVSGTGCVA